MNIELCSLDVLRGGKTNLWESGGLQLGMLCINLGFDRDLCWSQKADAAVMVTSHCKFLYTCSN